MQVSSIAQLVELLIKPFLEKPFTCFSGQLMKDGQEQNN